MQHNAVTILAILSMLLMASCKPETPGRLDIEPGAFQFASKGNYGHRVDERALFQIFHPLAPSSKGDYGTASVRLTLPASAKAPYLVSFYLSDNNEASNFKEPPSINARSGPISVIIDERTGHRFQKCWIDGAVVWKRDTIEANEPRFHTIDITEYVKPGREFELRFGMEEEVDSSERLPEDRFIESKVAGGVHSKMDFAKYETRSYWGDFVLHWGGVAQPVLQDHAWLKPLHPEKVKLKGALDIAELSLEVEKAELLKSRWAWPVSMGVPFPEGALKEASLGLKAAAGVMPLSASPMNRWPDASVRWARLQFTLPAGLEDEVITLSTKENGRAISQGQAVTVAVSGSGEAVRNGLLQVELRPQGAAAFVVKNARGEVLINGLEVFGESGGKPLKVEWQSVEEEETSEWQVRRALLGAMNDLAGNKLGEIRLSIDVFANVPYVRTRLAMTNYASGGTQFSQYGYRLGVVGMPDMRHTAKGWARGSSPAGQWVGVVKHFEHLWPNELKASFNGLELLCFKSGDERLPELKLGGGETLGSEMWFAFEETPISPEEAEVFVQMVHSPPRLNSSRMIRESKVWGGMVELNAQHPMYKRFIEGHLAAHYADTEEGVRFFGNYRGGVTANFYWNSIQSMYALYAMTGERRWFDWANRSAENMMDHLINHIPQQGREAGGVRFWTDDGPLKFDLKTQTCNGLFDYWAMSGDQRGLQLAKGVADFLAMDNGMRQGIYWRSARYQGWALIFLMAAYQETGEPRYLNAARMALETVTECVEPRRGAYLEHHGNPSFKGIIPFMNGILMTGLREMHQQTGDEDAARLLVSIARAIHAEMQVPGKPGYYEYSPDPYKRTVLATLNPGITAGQAYAAVLTADRQLLENAREGWAAFLREKPHAKRTFAFCYDLPAALYWLQKAEADLD